MNVANFAVDGYGLGQSYLRFQQVSRELDYDMVLFVTSS
jgi:hypothetical protein